MSSVLIAGCGPRNAIRIAEPNDPVVVQAVDAVDRFHGGVKQQRYQNVCQAADPGAFLGATSLSCPKFLAWVHQKLGDPFNAKHTGTILVGNHRQNSAVRVTLDYETDYEHGTAHEHFEWRIKGGTNILTSYQVVADALFH